MRAKGVRTYTSFLTHKISQETHERLAEFHFLHDTVFKVGGHTFETFYPGEGHAPDNIVVWLEKEKILHGGCFVKSSEATDLGNIKESNLRAWPVSLEKTKKKFPKPAYIIPGHQDWTGTKSIDHTLELLKKTKAG